MSTDYRRDTRADVDAVKALLDLFGKAEGYNKAGTALKLAFQMPRVLAELEQLRGAVARVEALLCDPYQGAPADGQLLIVGTRGGHQDLPYRERAYVRQDRPQGEKPYTDGDWYKIGDAAGSPHTFGELNWLDDPPCDRGSVTLDGPYIHVDDIGKALCGGGV